MKSQAVWKQWAATAALGCCLVMPAWAAGSFSFKKPGFINIERVYRESKQAQKIQQDLEKEFAPRKKAESVEVTDTESVEVTDTEEEA